MATHYVLGFAFSPTKDRVVLLEKSKPDWQRGKLNGVGGKVEPGESGIEAMVREFQEEATAKTEPEQWAHVAILRSESAIVDVFACWLDLDKVEAATEESIVLLDSALVPYRNTIPNLRWIVPLCLWKLLKIAEGNDNQVALDILGGLA